MRRFVSVLVATVTGLVVLLSFKTAPAKAPRPVALVGSCCQVLRLRFLTSSAPVSSAAASSAPVSSVPASSVPASSTPATAAPSSAHSYEVECSDCEGVAYPDEVHR